MQALKYHVPNSDTELLGISVHQLGFKTKSNKLTATAQPSNK